MRKPVEEIMVFSSKGKCGQLPGARARGEHDGLRGQGPGLAGAGGGRAETMTFFGPSSLALAFDILDLVLLEEEADALREAICGVAGFLPDLRVIEAGRVDFRAGGLEGGAPVDVERGLMDQGLGWNAADVEADASGRLLLDDRDGEPELGGSDRADVAAGTGADDDEVVFFFRDLSPCKFDKRTDTETGV